MPENVRKITPTDVSQFVRLDQCERFLRLRLAERAGQRFMEASDVAPQSIPPLLTLSGSEFEFRIEATMGGNYPTRDLAKGERQSGNRPADNQELARLVRELLPGGALVLFQPRLRRLPVQRVLPEVDRRKRRLVPAAALEHR